MAAIEIIGGGPAGAMAALAALREGARVRVFEKSTFPRHKVCGEFLSPEVVEILARVGCAESFLQLGPSSLRRLELHFGTRVVRRTLPRPGFGLSRAALDRLLLDGAVRHGAEIVHEVRRVGGVGRPVVLTCGRSTSAPRDRRLFGFKAHFRPTNHESAEHAAYDVVALYFFDGCYVGVSAVEGGAINVCGLAPERVLRDYAFEPSSLLDRCPSLGARLEGLEPAFEWLITGPVVLGRVALASLGPEVYPAGDALGFVDPFSGSGIFNAMLTGESAGRAAARRAPLEKYLGAIRQRLRRPFLVSRVCRAALDTGVAAYLVPFVPSAWLFELTRPTSDPVQC